MASMATWAKQQLSGYGVILIECCAHAVDVDVKNMTRSWADGFPFLPISNFPPSTRLPPLMLLVRRSVLWFITLTHPHYRNTKPWFSMPKMQVFLTRSSLPPHCPASNMELAFKRAEEKFGVFLIDISEASHLCL